MDKITETTEYETPRIEDHGDLTELTAATHNGGYLDGNYSQGTPLSQGILQTSP